MPESEITASETVDVVQSEVTSSELPSETVDTLPEAPESPSYAVTGVLNAEEATEPVQG
jgi:hypothetical protein